MNKNKLSNGIAFVTLIFSIIAIIFIVLKTIILFKNWSV